MTEEQRQAAADAARRSAEFVEAAMQNAIRQAINDGISISDTEEMKRRVEEARQAALKEVGLA